MSADKLKKKARAFAFIRYLNNNLNGYRIGNACDTVNGRPSPIMRYCLKKGYAKMRREVRSATSSYGIVSRTIFDAN
jgi:hypothetical protein